MNARWIWFHEKDRLRRWATKTAGRVAINQHGRLVVTEGGSR